MQLQGLTRNPGGQKSERMTIINFKNYQNFKYYENVKKSRKDIILFSWVGTEPKFFGRNSN